MLSFDQEHLIVLKIPGCSDTNTQCLSWHSLDMVDASYMPFSAGRSDRRLVFGDLL
jgi:hypothetical protein